MKIKHIIWDWNGTLLDDNWLSVTAINILLKKYKLPTIEKDQYLDIFSFPVIDYYEKLGFDFDKTPFSIIGTEFIKEYTDRMYKPKLHIGTRNLLSSLMATGVTHSLLSAAKQQMLDELIDYHNLNQYFIKVVGLDNHYANSKLERGKEWMNELHFGSHEVLFVGDTLHDLDVANDIGADCVLIANGHNSYERLKAAGNGVFHNLTEFYNWFTTYEKNNK